ncbi:peptidylprolyl isomerase [Spiroplasma endosymbiont of Aspidapion aeneum]|uniref:peptidylprolyl isomerase n=1 Tax=Spiroplasma endosymbiont of Aspidapion aeneum TaxID=3066276 RepID=UPI00313C99F3
MAKNIVIELTDGRVMNAELYPELAPISVSNFIDLIKNNFFDNLIFHRIIEGFVIQGGGMYENMEEKEKLKTIKGEFEANGWDKNKNLSHVSGVLSMARTPAYDSATSQFFICVGDASFLDGQYASFGRLIDKDSIDIALKIASEKKDSNDKPLNPIIIKTIKEA